MKKPPLAEARAIRVDDAVNKEAERLAREGEGESVPPPGLVASGRLGKVAR